MLGPQCLAHQDGAGAPVIEVEDIYEAAFSRERFPGLLSNILGAMRAQSGFLGWIDVANQTRFEVEVGNDPAFLQSYMETYAAHDVMRPTLLAADEGVVMPAYDVLQSPVVQGSIFYREWLAPQRVVDNLATNLIKQAQMSATLSVVRTGEAPPFSAAEIEAFRELVPHLRRAVMVQARLVRQENLLAGYRRICAGARNGLILLDADLRILDVDPRTEALTGIQAGQALGQAGGARAFGAAVREAVRGGSPVAVELSRESDGPLTLLCVAQPLPRDPFGDLDAGPSVADAVYVLRVDEPAQVAFASFGRLYGLTPTELRVMSDAFAHADLTNLGERLGMAQATARTHLHRIYEKTGAQGFPALCLLAHRFTLPG